MEKAHTQEYQSDVLVVEAEALKEAVRLEDLHIWQMEKVKTKKRADSPMATGWPPGMRVAKLGMSI